MRIWDISMPVHAEMPVWKGKDEKRPHLIMTRDFQNGKGGGDAPCYGCSYRHSC